MLYVSVCGQFISTPIKAHANTVHTADSWQTCLMQTQTASLHFDEYPPLLSFWRHLLHRTCSQLPSCSWALGFWKGRALQKVMRRRRMGRRTGVMGYARTTDRAVYLYTAFSLLYWVCYLAVKQIESKKREKMNSSCNFSMISFLPDMVRLGCAIFSCAW